MVMESGHPGIRKEAVVAALKPFALQAKLFVADSRGARLLSLSFACRS
jgi:hypothetical protein